eukprot:522546-Pyramimonas_sp.AAC.1
MKGTAEGRMCFWLAHKSAQRVISLRSTSFVGETINIGGSRAQYVASGKVVDAMVEGVKAIAFGTVWQLVVEMLGLDLLKDGYEVSVDMWI